MSKKKKKNKKRIELESTKIGCYGILRNFVARAWKNKKAYTRKKKHRNKSDE